MLFEAGWWVHNTRLHIFPCTSSVPLPWDQTFSWWHPLAMTAGRERCRHTGAKKGTLRREQRGDAWIGGDVFLLCGRCSTVRHNVDTCDSIKHLNVEFWCLTAWPWWHYAEGARVQSSLVGPQRIKLGEAVGCSPVKQLHGTRKAAETALHEYGLVALAVNNPQLAVRLCCTAKDTGRRSGWHWNNVMEIRGFLTDTFVSSFFIIEFEEATVN